MDQEADNRAQYLLADNESISCANVDGCEKRDSCEYVEAYAVEIVIDLGTDGKKAQ